MPNDGHAFWERTAGRYDVSMALLGGPLGPMCDPGQPVPVTGDAAHPLMPGGRSPGASTANPFR